MSFHEARIMSTLLRRYASNHDGRTFPEARQFHQPVVVCVPYASRRRAGFHSPPSLPTTQFSNTLLTGGINHERTFPFRHDSHSCQDTHDGGHFAYRLSAAAFAPQPSAAGDSRNLHGSCGNRLADWAAQTLKPGARVYVKGYLTQKLRGDVTMTDVTAAQFFVQNPAGMDAENQLAS